MRISERIYRILLRAYPSRYRRRYAEPMEQLFRDKLRETDTLGGAAKLWLRTLADLAASVPARHWETIMVHESPLAEPARRCFFFARAQASSFSRREITVEHLLLGILREQPSLVHPGAKEAIVLAIESGEPCGRRVPPMEDLSLSNEAKQVIAAAQERAQAAGREVIPADLAAAILRHPNSLAARLLRKHLSANV